MKKLKSKEEIQAEIQKCKEDIVYFIENYAYPEIKLTDNQKFMLDLYKKAEESKSTVVILQGRVGTKYFLQSSYERHEEFKKDPFN